MAMSIARMTGAMAVPAAALLLRQVAPVGESAFGLQLAGWALPPLLKFASVGASGTAASFAIAAGLLRRPGARRVI